MLQTVSTNVSSMFQGNNCGTAMGRLTETVKGEKGMNHLLFRLRELGYNYKSKDQAFACLNS